MSFPIINISHLTKYINGELLSQDFILDEKIQQLSKEFADAFMEWGFVYVVEHGIPVSTIKKTYDISKNFFDLEKSVKEKFIRSHNNYWGWSPFKFETFEESRPFDLKECFDFFPTNSYKSAEVQEYAPDFVSTQRIMYDSCKKLAMNILKLLNVSLETEDQDYLLAQHQHMGKTGENETILRVLYYPSISNNEHVFENQLRCGEHSDYGTITLLFQDQAGGLQVKSPHGDYINATPVPGSIIVNGGDLLEIWSSGRFKSTHHRVVLPDSADQKARQSIAFFVQPDNDVTVSCLDSSEKYESVNSLKYLMHKFKQTYILR